MDPVEATVRAVGRRLGLQGLVDAVGAWLALGLGAAATLALVHRLLAPPIPVALLAAGPVILALSVALAVALERWPTLSAAALAADRRLSLDERLASALEPGAGPMAALVHEDASRRAAAVRVAESFPLRWPPLARRLPLAAVALLVALVLPPQDLLGWAAARQARAERAEAARRAARGVQDALDALAHTARQRGLGDAAGAVEQVRQRVAGSSAEPRQAEAAARAAAQALQAQLEARRAARRTATDPTARERLLREEGVLRRAQRAVEDWQAQLAGTPRPSPQPGHNGSAPPPSPLVRRREPPPPPQEVAELERRVLDARPDAQAALARPDIPWWVRAAVRRYFSPDGGTPAPAFPQP